MSPFRPAGDRARWRVIYDMLAATETGGTVTYEGMAARLGLGPEDRHLMQVAMRRAAREFLLLDSRSVEPVPNVGYRVVEPEKHLVLARQHQAKAVNSVRRGHDQVVHVDLTGMDPATVEIFKAVAFKFAEQDEMIRRLDVRTRRNEKLIAAATSGNQATQQQLADLRERLERLESGVRQD